MVKLIDVHRHLWGFEWFPPSHLRNNAEGLAKKTGRTTEQVLERIAQSPTMDATGQAEQERERERDNETQAG